MSTHPFTATAPAAVLGAARGEVVDITDRIWAAVGDSDLVDGVAEVQRLRSALAAVEAQMLAELDTRGVAKTVLHWGSTTDWYAHVAGVSPGRAKQTIRSAHHLVGDRAATREALTAGTVSPDQAALIIRAVGDLPAEPAIRAEAETLLLDEATRLGMRDLKTAADAIAERVDPDGAAAKAEKDLDREERGAHLYRDLSISDDGMGGVRIRGRGSVEDGAVLRAALLPLTKPAPAADAETGSGEPTVDPRDHGARMWDALVQLAQHALATDLPPDAHGARPRVTVTVDLDALREDIERRTHTSGQARPHGPARTDDGVRLSAATVRRMACDADLIPVALATDAITLDLGRSTRTCPHHLWTALVARDRHCAFPGCTRPPVMGHAHHIWHWADGGPTALHNLASCWDTPHLPATWRS